jgi:hypothetical protein
MLNLYNILVPSIDYNYHRNSTKSSLCTVELCMLRETIYNNDNTVMKNVKIIYIFTRIVQTT